MNADPLVLVIEDDVQIRRLIKTSLMTHHYGYLETDEGRRAIELAASHNPDLVLLDLALPDMDGIDVTAELRSWTTVPIIVISARSQESEKVKVLDIGADDYMTKPFGSRELLARIRVALRHRLRDANGRDISEVNAGELRIDMARHKVTIAGKYIHLTPFEFKLLSVLARNSGKVLTHRQLLTETWGKDHANASHYLRVYMGQLRNKLERDPSRPDYLVTEHGIGYRLRAEQST